MRRLFRALLIYVLLLITPATHAYYSPNSMRGMPFIEMMIAMMDFMEYYFKNRDSSYSRFYPYNPLLGGMAMSPMQNQVLSPFGSALPLSNNTANLLNSTLVTDKNDTLLADKAIISNSINGIWQAMSGDIIAIYNDNYFIWSDGISRHLAGRMIFKGNELYAYIPANNTTLRFQVQVDGNQFIAKDIQGQIYTFKRIH